MMEDDYYDKKLKSYETSYRFCFWSFIAVVVMLIVAFLTSCTTTRYVPVETIKTEVKHVHDTVTIRDSVKNDIQTVIREADTTEIDRLNKEYGFKLDKAQRTILILRRELEHSSHNQSESRDSIVYKDKEVQVPVPVEKKLTRWQQVKLDLGEWMVGIIILSIVIFCVYLARGKVCRGR